LRTKFGYSNQIFILQVTGSKAPQLKRLGTWLMENPMFDVDPKWAELVKERGNLPHDLQKRLSGNERSSVNKGKSPGRPPMMPSPTSQQSASTANLAATSMASSLNFPLGNLNSSLLSSLSLGNFDPKNPLLMPFGGLTNLGALGGLGNISNLSNIGLTNSLFNLAGLNLPSLAGMEAALNAQAATSSAAAAAAAAAAADANNPVVSSANSSSSKNAGAGSSNISGSGGSSSGGGSSKSRSSKLDQPSTSKSSASGGPSTLSAVSSASLPTPSPFPFLFTNPSLLYTPLTLSGLNPFSMQSGGVSSAYESLAQCGLLNPPTSSASMVRKPTSSSSSSRQRETVPESSTSSSSSSSSTTKRKEPEKKSSRYPVDPAITLQQYTDMAALHSGEERRRVEQQQQQSQQQHEKRETAITEQTDVVAADLSEKKIERKNKEQDVKETLEHLSRTSTELVTRNIDDAPRTEKLPSRNRSSTDSNQNSDQQQQRLTPSAPPPLEVTLEPVAKKMRTEMDTSTKSSASSDVPTVEIEPVTRPLQTTPTKVAQQPASSQEETSNVSLVETSTTKKEPNETTTSSTSSSTFANATSPSTQTTGSKSDSGKPVAPETEEDGKGGTKAPKKARSGKRLSVEPPPERKNLRSSAGRQARAAAERQARMEGEMQQSEQQQQDSHVAGE